MEFEQTPVLKSFAQGIALTQSFEVVAQNGSFSRTGLCSFAWKIVGVNRRDRATSENFQEPIRLEMRREKDGGREREREKEREMVDAITKKKECVVTEKRSSVLGRHVNTIIRVRLCCG